jgi:hypothetical protein
MSACSKSAKTCGENPWRRNFGMISYSNIKMHGQQNIKFLVCYWCFADTTGRISHGSGCQQACTGFVIASLSVITLFNSISSVFLVLWELWDTVCGPLGQIACQLVIVQGDQKVSVHLMITVQKTRKIL